MNEELRWAIGFTAILLVNTVILTRWINTALHRLESKLQEERSARIEHTNAKIAEVYRDMADIRTKYWEAKGSFSDLELRVTQQFNLYPTRGDIRDLLVPLATKVETVHEELVRRGVKSTAVGQNSHG